MEFFLLGQVRVLAAGQHVGLGGRKQRLLLAVLALEANRPVTVGRLIDLLWPESEPPSARGMIHAYVSRIRAVLREAKAGGVQLAREQGGYILRCDPERIDVHRFRSLVDQARDEHDEARVRSLTRALALWRDSALAGTASPELQVRLCGGLEEARLTAIEDLVEARLRLGDYEGVLHELVALTGEHRLRPRLVEALMRLLHHDGRTAEALEVYERLRRGLRDERGLDPPTRLRDLQLTLLRNEQVLDLATSEAAPEGVVPRQLPRDLTTFTGRRKELDLLLRGSKGAARPCAAVTISVIDGMAGVGKTVLAVHAAHRLAGEFPDGQFFIDLHGFTQGVAPLEPSDALAQVLWHMGVPEAQIPPAVDARAAIYRSVLAGKRMLILLDNAATEAQVIPLLPSSATCLVLITSRSRLAGLDDATSMSLDILPPRDARALLTRIAGEKLPAELVAEIVELCGRLPLAIRLAGARLRTSPPDGAVRLAERLRDRQRRLAELQAGGRSVSAEIDLTYRRLGRAQRRLYRLLGRYAGRDIDRYAAAALADIGITKIDQLLYSLVQSHLLDEPELGRYRFHDLVREHAAAAGQEEGECTPTCDGALVYLRAR